MFYQLKGNIEMNDLNFRNRLTRACDESPLVPAKHAGRLVYLAEKMNVSAEAVRQWFEGRKPRHDKMERLAKTIGVDPAWLAVGVDGETVKAKHEKINATLDGAVNVLVGLINVSGGVCAIPDDMDPRKDIIDFYMVYGGKQHGFGVSVAAPVGENHYKAKFRMGYDSIKNILYVPRNFSFLLFWVDNITIDHNKYRDGVDWACDVTEDEDGSFFIKEKKLLPVLSIEDLL